MTAPSTTAYTPADDPQRHNRVLLHAWQTMHPVMHRGLQQHIHGLRCMTEGSTQEVVVYLAGYPTPVPASEVLLAPHIE